MAGSDPSVREVTAGAPQLAQREPVVQRRTSSAPKVEVQSREDFYSLLEVDLNTLDPSHSYRWCRKHPLRISRLKARHYSVVDGEAEEIRNLVGERLEVAEDGTITVGDLILMRCPKNHRRARRAKIRKVSEERLKQPKKKFKRDARRGGVPVITDKED